MNVVLKRTSAVALGVIATLAILAGSASAQDPTADPLLTDAVSDAASVMRVNLLAVFGIVVAAGVILLAAWKAWKMLRRVF